MNIIYETVLVYLMSKKKTVLLEKYGKLRTVISKICLNAFENSREIPNFKNEENDLKTLF